LIKQQSVDRSAKMTLNATAHRQQISASAAMIESGESISVSVCNKIAAIADQFNRHQRGAYQR